MPGDDWSMQATSNKIAGNIFDVTDDGLTLVLCMKSVSVEHFAELGSDETGWGECRL